ncbi:hypothetical protein J7E91_14465 [Streptomyces sp. ISL-99]|uniref:hypothetical protein n=1 Tax=Streptomyces sp. ISL-99 TaxID=2819193 RepID=UPI001BEA5C01|nr:hypothetical protein [Streptomyces sp. ISL-99]
MGERAGGRGLGPGGISGAGGISGVAGKAAAAPPATPATASPPPIWRMLRRLSARCLLS